jgi:oxygen-independent coproporphyrinogen-3 oxidase
MCRFEFSIPELESAYLIDFERYFAAEAAQLAQYRDVGLIECEEGWIRVTRHGRPFLRALCMVFDRYLRDKPGPARYSRLI